MQTSDRQGALLNISFIPSDPGLKNELKLWTESARIKASYYVYC